LCCVGIGLYCSADECFEEMVWVWVVGVRLQQFSKVCDQSAPPSVHNQIPPLGRAPHGPGQPTHLANLLQSDPNNPNPYHLLEALISGAIQANTETTQLTPTAPHPNSNKLGDRIWHIHGWAGCRITDDLPTFWNNFNSMRSKNEQETLIASTLIPTLQYKTPV
jgi:hypothetical protein